MGVGRTCPTEVDTVSTLGTEVKDGDMPYEVEVDTLVDVANAVSYCTLSVAVVHAYSMEPFYLRIVNPVVILPPFSHWSCLVK